MRMTQHNARRRKDGSAFSVEHNDRRFDLSKAEHIDQDRLENNRYWDITTRNDIEMAYDHYKRSTVSFKDSERREYEIAYGDALRAQNEKHELSRHRERICTIDDWLEKKYPPEETILQLGSSKDGFEDIDKLWELAIRQAQWEQEHYNVRYLNMALHADEQGAPHVHMRKMWLGTDKNGRCVPSQNKALTDVERPDPNKPMTRWNNPKMSYSRACREHTLELCHELGLEIELEPLEHSRTGLSQEEYKARQEQERAELARQELERTQQENIELLRQIEGIQLQLDKTQQELKRILDRKTVASAIHEPSIFDRLSGKNQVTIDEQAYKELLTLGKDMKREAQQVHEDLEQMKSLKTEMQELEPHYKAAKTYEANARADRMAAKQELETAQHFRENAEAYIDRGIEQRAQHKFNEFMRQFESLEKGKAQRLKRFCEKTKYQDGTSLYEEFERQDRKRVQELEHSWGMRM